MLTDDLIRHYIASLMRELPAEFRFGGRAASEVEAHLRDSIDALCRQGMTLEEATAIAIERFGPPSVVAEEFAKTPYPESEVTLMLRISLTALVVFTTALAAMMISFSDMTQLPHANALPKLAFAGAILAYNAFLMVKMWRGRAERAWESPLVFGGGLALILLGAWISMWAVHFGLVSDDWKGYGIVGALLLVAQGVLAATAALVDANARAAAPTA